MEQQHPFTNHSTVHMSSDQTDEFHPSRKRRRVEEDETYFAENTTLYGQPCATLDTGQQGSDQPQTICSLGAGGLDSREQEIVCFGMVNTPDHSCHVSTDQIL
jgi:hypothetical protein